MKIPKRIIYKPKYSTDVTYLKIIGNYLKIVRMNYVRNSGIEYEKNKSLKNIIPAKAPPSSVNEKKLVNNIARAKSIIYELALCNNWDWFTTLTLDKEKQNRQNLDMWHRQLTQWIRDYNKKYNLQIKFLLVPEKHKDGKNWHMHGLLHGLPISHLQQFKIGDVMGTGIAKKVIAGETVYNWKHYQERFGFCELENVKNHEAVSKYITKYITKDLLFNVTALGGHMYYHSRGLKRAKTIKKGSMLWNNIKPDFFNDYCSIKTIPYSEQNLEKILNRFLN